MSNVLTPRQVEAVKKVVTGAARAEDMEQLRGVTADDLDAHADHLDEVLALHKALRDAYRETGRLVAAHGVGRARDLRSLGIALPAEEVTARIVRAHAEGEISDEELRALGLADVDALSTAAPETSSEIARDAVASTLPTG